MTAHYKVNVSKKKSCTHCHRIQDQMAQPPDVIQARKEHYDTELSKYLWELKTKKEEFTVSWKILAKARAYSNISKRCKLCIEEKYFIIRNPQTTTNPKRAHQFCVFFEFSNALLSH